MLRDLREAYGKLLALARELDFSQQDLGEQMATKLVISDLQERWESTGRLLDVLERTPVSWR